MLSLLMCAPRTLDFSVEMSIEIFVSTKPSKHRKKQNACSYLFTETNNKSFSF